MSVSARLLMVVLLMGPILMLAGCESVNLTTLAIAGQNAYRAATLSSEDVQLLSERARERLDGEHTMAQPGNPYHDRLYRLIDEEERFENVTYDIEVYLDDTVNAFALPDGSIRIYSGLMDMMDDDEVLFVIGHEMGHVKNEDTLDKLRVAYATEAVQAGLASLKNEVGQVSASWVGELTNALINSQFSQLEEKAADDYGLYYLSVRGLPKNASVSALEKLATLGSGHTFLSTHPEPGARAERMRERIASTDAKIIEPKPLEEKGRRTLKDLQEEAVNRTKDLPFRFP